MSKRRKKKVNRTNYREMPIAHSEHIPEDDRFVLKEQPGLPLERGGIYSEMGADMTYEELSSFPSTSGEFMHYEQAQSKKTFSSVEIMGFLLVVCGFFIVFVSPFWFSVITLGITLISVRYRLTVTMYTALTFAIIGFIFAVYSLM